MAINPTSFPMPQAFSGGVDFSPLANLGNVYRQGQQQAAQQQALAQLGPDPVANNQFLIKSGVPELVQAGIRGQAEQATRAENIRQFNLQQAIREKTSKREQEKFEQDSPEYRGQQIKDLGLDPNDPAVKAWRVTGQNFPGARAGMGQPIMGKDPVTGQTKMFQLSSTGPPIEVQLPGGTIPMTPGETAAQKTEATSMAKAKASAAAILPKYGDLSRTNIEGLEALKTDPGRDAGTGGIYGQLPDDSYLLGSKGRDFRNNLAQVKGQAYLAAFDTLRGAGAISNQEGEAAKNALLSLSTVTSSKQFENQIDKAIKYYKLGLARLQRQAQGDFSDHPGEIRPPDYVSGQTPPAAAPVVSGGTKGESVTSIFGNAIKR
jgi:hypothetical protein